MGETVITIYAIDGVKQMSNDQHTDYTTMLILDVITVISMYIGCGVSKLVKWKTLLLVATSFVIIKHQYITISLLSGYSIAVSCGTLLLSKSLCTELLPLNNRIAAAFI